MSALCVAYFHVGETVNQQIIYLPPHTHGHSHTHTCEVDASVGANYDRNLDCTILAVVLL